MVLLTIHNICYLLCTQKYVKTDNFNYSQFYAQIFCLSGHMTLYWLKHGSLQSYVRFAVRFAASVRPCGRSQTKLHTSGRFSLNVRRPYDARTLVLRSHAGLSPDVLVELQDCRKCGRATVVQTSWVVGRFVGFLRQTCNKAQGRCTVITRQWTKYVSESADTTVRTHCVSCSSFGSLVAVLRPHKIARKMNMSNI